MKMNVSTGSIDQRRGLSIAIAAILILSALVVALPAIVPGAQAGVAGTVTASSTTIFGNMVVQITVTDVDIAGANASMPNVEVNKALKINDNAVDQPSGPQGGDVLPMYQAIGGSWVGFVTIGTPAATVPASPPPQDPSDPTGGYDTDITNGYSREYVAATVEDVNNATATVQVPGASFTIIYYDSDPVGSRSVTIAVSTTGRTGSISVDRTVTPPNGTTGAALIYPSISDPDRNLDPTGADSIWIILADGTTPAEGNYTIYTGTTILVGASNLTETGPNTGVFEDADGVQVSDGAAYLPKGTILTITYNEAAPSTPDPTKNVAVDTKTGSLSLDKASYKVSDGVAITLSDPDLNLNTAAVDYSRWDADFNAATDFTTGSGTIDPGVLLIKGFNAANWSDPTAGGNASCVVLAETGLNTGIFTGTAYLTMTPPTVEGTAAGGSPVLYTIPNDVITAYYKDERNVVYTANYTVTVSATFGTTTGTLSLDKATYLTNDVATVTLVDPDRNTDATTIQSWYVAASANMLNLTEVVVYSSEDTTEREVQMVETGANTNTFTGTFSFTTAASTSQAQPIIKVAHGAVITTKYYDQYDSAGSSQVVATTASFSALTNTGTIALDKGSYSPGPPNIANCINANGAGGTVKITVVDPDLNVNALVHNLAYADITTSPVRAGYPVTNIVLTETGPNTNTYEGYHTLKAGVDRNDIIEATYTDAVDSAGNTNVAIKTSAIALTNTGTITVDRTTVPLKGQIKVTVTDPDWNLSPTTPENIPEGNAVGTWGGVDYYTTSTPSTAAGLKQILLTETGADTGVFEQTVEVGTTTAGILVTASRGDTVTFRYDDAQTAGGATVKNVATAKVTATSGTISLDKTTYPLNGKITFTITDPDLNEKPTANENVNRDRVTVTTTSFPTGITGVAQLRPITETGPDTGVFVGDVVVGTDIAALVGDGVTVTYLDEVDATGRVDVAVPAAATIAQNTGTLKFDKNTYMITEAATVTLTDPDVNVRPTVVEPQTITVWSATDPAGVSVTLIETGADTGVFSGKMTFTTASSAGSTLKAKDGDLITARYIDNNPNPADVPGWTFSYDPVMGTYTQTIKIVTTTTLIGVPIPAVPITSKTPVLQDTMGKPISEAKKGTQVLLSTDMSNTATVDVAMLYIVQVKDATGRVVYLSFVSGTIPAGKTYTFGIAWTPALAGDYKVEVFAWKSWTDPTPLSEVASAPVKAV